MPENVPICLYNRDRATDFPQPKDSRYFAFQRFRDASKNDEWWDQLEPRILVSSEECFKNQNFDKKELEKMNLSPRRLLCVHTPNEDGRYLLNFYRGRYFLRGMRVFHPLLPSRTKIYRDILAYVKHISGLADDIPVFPPVPPEIQAIEFSIQGNLSFQNCGSKWIRSKRSNDDPTDGFEETKFVFSGYTAREDSHPWHADIENLENGTQCGGTLISSRTVLTAAHCIFEMNVKDFEVTVGMYDKRLKYNDTKIQIQTPSKLVTHPAYRSDQFHYDVGLLIFEKEGYEINNQVRPICLWNEGSSLSRVTGKSAVLVGFGLTEHYSLSDTLQEARLSIRKHEECYLSNRILFGKRLRPGDNFCAGFTNGVSACLGDSGGSLSIKKNGRWFIRGIVSFGLSKRVILDGEEQIACNPNSFSLYADVAYYMDWIVRNSLDISFKN
ncbi:chymotrypsin B-like [Cloeon dipterum]|uniref:chymotrypsin B-like n=1 Tax=Cloeon dipterum TaxID=197152 RepID=UPI00321FA568